MDLADQIDDYICSFEGIGDLAMDSLAIFVFIWAVIALFLVWLCKFLYRKYYLKIDSTTTTVTDGTKTATGGAITPNGKAITNSIGATKLLSGSGVGGGVGGLIDQPRRLSEPREILASKETKELSSVRPLGGGLGGGGLGGGSMRHSRGHVPATPPTRKRIVRQSPGPELRKKRTVLPPANVVGPETSSVTWTSQVFRWLYSDLVIVNELLNTWVHTLNENLKNSVENYWYKWIDQTPIQRLQSAQNHPYTMMAMTFQFFLQHGVGIEIVRVLPDSPPPTLANLFCQANEQNPADMVITMDCDAQPILQVKAYRQKNGKVETSHYKVTVSRFRGRLSINQNYNTLKGDMRVEGFPDIRIAMNSVGHIKPIDQDEQQLQDVISEIVTHALRDSLYPVDFSIYATCPRAEIEIPEIPVNLPIHYDSLAYNMEHLNANRYGGTPLMSSGKRLLVKIVKGDGLAACEGAYVVIEMDEPPQKNQTGARQGTNPYWDEHFLFDLTAQSAEILFEVYDSPIRANDPPKFLGLGLVGIDELAVGPASSQTLALQPRPYETENVQGAIQVEFVFIEGAEIPSGPRPYKLKEALRISTPIINEHIKNGSNLADAAVKALKEGALATEENPSKSTLIIHSVQRSRSPYKVESVDGKIVVTENVSDNKLESDVVQQQQQQLQQQHRHSTSETTASPTDSVAPQILTDDNTTINTTDSGIKNVTGNEEILNGTVDSGKMGQPLAESSPHQQLNGHGNVTSHGGILMNHNNYHPSNTHNLTNNNDALYNEENRGRAQKKRDFFGTLKRRLGRSKTRTQSAERGMIPIDPDDPGAVRSLSMDRGIASNSHSMAGHNKSRFDRSRQSSISESSAISGFSSASSKTFVHESSTLVLETIENGVKRHFLVPLEIAQRPRWRRKGTKLHIYNDHTFIAKHLSGGLSCTICTKSIPRRPGKQGYECRDCQLICHKQCHIRAPQSCPNPTILSMELSKINSPAADKSIRRK
ncbi:uncharacterized protein LOC129613411 isoform X2 [Condylostylus longicornis]|uniref:uncharacterized protein LOC129613411 isoform X2 n=1 Tax=Condylostylus longicornis TaxID=2530218 RepID=UPI00244E404D|nr:uncharacterized protein LOC129613411 isoform X2 [Condylostylus longicornis]